jgi:hypothetical protein
VVAGSAVAAGGWDPGGAAWTARVGALAVALAVAARSSVPSALAVGIAAALGLAVGHQATWPERAALARPWLFALGLGTGVAVAWGYVVSFRLRFRALWAEIALRVVGSWIATIALLVSALALARR